MSRPTTLVDDWKDLPTHTGDWREGLQLGPFRLKRALGRGGMGMVWLAEQLQPLSREVAIKVMLPERRNPLSEAHFEVERQALAQLSHRAIAQIFDAGRLPDGALFFAMEYVPGVPLDDYLLQRRPTHRELARLLIELCAGVQHAHQRGLIHRDIKPANILIQDVDGVAQPKLIDFGVAIGAASGSTARRRAGTPAYMSPEQLQPGPAGIDVRSDVYTLGAVLAHALYLLGDVPLAREDSFSSASLREELEQSLAGHTPPENRLRKRLNRLQALPSELRAIAVRAMDEDRDGRYASASALAEDLQRWLQHAPVRAMGDSRGYRLRCFLRRHAWGSALGAVLLLGLLGVMFLMSIQSRRVEREALRANAANAELEQVVAFQSRQLAEIDLEQMGAQLRSAVIAQQRRGLEAQGGRSEPELAQAEADLAGELAVVNFTDLARQVLDEQIIERALRTVRQDFAAQPLVQARLLYTVADTAQQLGLLERGTEAADEAYALRRASSGEQHPDTLEAQTLQATLLQDRGQLEAAEAVFRKVMAAARLALGPDTLQTLDAINNLALLLHLRGQYAEAQPLYLEALAGYRKLQGPMGASTLQAMNNLGGLLRDQGEFAQAEPYWREVLASRRKQLGDDHPETISSINSLSSLLQSMGQSAAALPLAEEALARGRRVRGNEHPDTLPLIGNLGVVLRSLGRLDEASRYTREALDTARRTVGPEHPATLVFMSSLGSLLREQGDLAAAAELWQDVLRIRQRVLGVEHPGTLLIASNLGDLLRERGDTRAAVDLLRAQEAAARKVWTGGNAVRLGLLLMRLGRAELALGDLDALRSAETHLLEAHRTLEALGGAESADTQDAISALIELYGRWSQLDPGERPRAEAERWGARRKAGAPALP